MKFERLRLAGFKTFVDPTDIVIAPGLTGIVGPNGCGKSNLVEALRWVMGETSSKSLRGGGMEDVIFSGSGSRPERNHAEVSIRISAPPDDLPAHLAGVDHVDISRKIVREQGSTYRMNGREVRARDVQILFADAASGARSPSMVRQGQIGEIIAAKPQHRRRILEDAAGVAGLHARRHEAELRLRQAEDNLARAEDILTQLDRQIADLRKQARSAEKYKALQAEIRDLELLLIASGHERAEAEAREAVRDHEMSIRAIAVATTRQGETERARAVAEHEIEALRRSAGTATATHQKLILARETLEGELRLAETRLNEIAQRQQEITRDAEAARNVQADADGAIARLADEETALAGWLLGLEQARLAERETRAEAEDARARAEVAFSAAQGARAEAEATRRAAASRLAETTARAERLARALVESRQEYDALIQSDQGLQRVSELQRIAEMRLAEYQTALEASETAEKASHTARAEEQALRPRLAEAERLAQRLETEARTIRKLVDNAEPGLWTPVVDLITVGKGYETALAAALGDDLEAAIEWSAARYWAETGLTPDALPPLPGDAQPATLFVKAPANLTPRLSQVGIVASRAEGEALRLQLRPGQRLVTREGDLWRWDGFIGKAEAPSAAARRLAERNRLAEIEANAKTAKQKRDAAREALDSALAVARKAQERESVSREAARRAAIARDNANTELQRETRRTEEARLRMESARNRIETLGADHIEAETSRKAAEDALTQLPPAATHDAVLAELAQRLADSRRREAEFVAAESQRKAQADAAIERRGAILAERAAWEERIIRARRASEEQAERLQKLAVEAARLESLPAELIARRRSIAAELDEAEAESRRAADRLATGETTLRAADEAAREAFRALSDAREASARLEAQAGHARERLDHVVREIEKRIEAPISSLAAAIAALPDKLPREPEKIEARLFDLRSERDKLGAVNLRADIELGEVEGERGNLAREREDITGAIRKFRRAIDTLNTEGRTRLRAAFDVVNGHFGTLFGRLFGGGEAELQLVEADDPLEAGLEILAKPPGKKPQLLTLLSGGEQALTATALIFAVFLTNPAPICVLDEVDAPLDDSNVERLCDLLHDMARDTQTRFLMITHNPISMARMDRLYGVTMVERGVSQLVSVDLEQAERLAEAG